jgi:hypothetical protein
MPTFTVRGWARKTLGPAVAAVAAAAAQRKKARRVVRRAAIMLLLLECDDASTRRVACGGVSRNVTGSAVPPPSDVEREAEAKRFTRYEKRADFSDVRIARRG